MRKELREFKKRIWARRHRTYPHLVDIDIVYDMVDLLEKELNTKGPVKE